MLVKLPLSRSRNVATKKILKDLSNKNKLRKNILTLNQTIMKKTEAQFLPPLTNPTSLIDHYLIYRLDYRCLLVLSAILYHSDLFPVHHFSVRAQFC